MSAPARLPATVGWGLFCAASWTWCIGMFLPLIMLRDDGWLGFLAFAVPNVLGCAAFGYVRSRAACRAGLSRSASALRLFSVVTVAYQLFFVGFVMAALSPWNVSPLAVGLGVLIVAAFLGGHRPGARIGGATVGADRGRFAWPTLMALGVGVWVVSLAMMAILGVGGWTDFGATGVKPAIDTVWLVPVLAFGFLLCPYLDGTFHVARIHAPSRHAFAVFGVSFAVMLLFSAAYASTLLRQGLVWPVMVHLLLQLAFTSAVHIRIVHDLRPPDRRGSSLPWLVWIVAPLAGMLLVPATTEGFPGPFAPVVGEAWYLRWLALYGLLFPALVLLIRHRSVGDPTARTAPMALALLVGLVLCELGFIHGHRWLIPIAVAAVVTVGLWPSRASSLQARAA